MAFKKRRTWVFWYEQNRNGNKIVIGFQNCSSPDHTNFRKQLRAMFSHDDITSTGHTTELTDPFLVWPQSPLNTK